MYCNEMPDINGLSAISNNNTYNESITIFRLLTKANKTQNKTKSKNIKFYNQDVLYSRAGTIRLILQHYEDCLHGIRINSPIYT